MSIQFALVAVTLLTFASASLFAVLEIRRANRARQEKAAFDLFMSVIIEAEHVQALFTVLKLPEGASPRRIVRSKELMRAANLLMFQYEFFGVTVFQRIVPLRTFDLLTGGVVRSCWKKLAPYIEAERKATGSPNIAEWFQWLAEQLEQHAAPEKKLGAHVAFRSWSP